MVVERWNSMNTADVGIAKNSINSTDRYPSVPNLLRRNQGRDMSALEVQIDASYGGEGSLAGCSQAFSLLQHGCRALLASVPIIIIER